MKKLTFTDFISENGMCATMGTIHADQFQALPDAPCIPNNKHLEAEFPLKEFWVFQKRPRQIGIVPFDDVADYFEFNEQVMYDFATNNLLVVIINERPTLSGSSIHNVLIIEGLSRATAQGHLHEVRVHGDAVILYSWGRCSDILPYLLAVNQEQVRSDLRDGSFFGSLRGDTAVASVEPETLPVAKMTSKAHFAGASGHFTK